jgi:hypothetical protein
MTNEQTVVHPNVEELTDYFASELTPEAQDVLERHLGTCSVCSQLARHVYNSTLLLERWSSTAEPALDLLAVLRHSLTTLLEKSRASSWQNRLRRWTEDFGAQADGAVRMIVETSAKAVTVVTNGIDEVLRPEARWQFALQPAPLRIRGQSEHGSISIATTASKPRARVAISSEAREVEVRIDDWPSDQLPPLALLAPVGATLEPKIQELSRIPGVSYCIARFENVQPGEYLIALEPTP